MRRRIDSADDDERWSSLSKLAGDIELVPSGDASGKIGADCSMKSASAVLILMSVLKNRINSICGNDVNDGDDCDDFARPD